MNSGNTVVYNLNKSHYMWKTLKNKPQGIHTIRLYLPPVHTTIHNVIPPLIQYIPSDKTLLLLNITGYSYVTSICMNICIYLLLYDDITPFVNKLPHGTPHH